MSPSLTILTPKAKKGKMVSTISSNAAWQLSLWIDTQFFFALSHYSSHLQITTPPCTCAGTVFAFHRTELCMWHLVQRNSWCWNTVAKHRGTGGHASHKKKMPKTLMILDNPDIQWYNILKPLVIKKHDTALKALLYIIVVHTASMNWITSLIYHWQFMIETKQYEIPFLSKRKHKALLPSLQETVCDITPIQHTLKTW